MANLSKNEVVSVIFDYAVAGDSPKEIAETLDCSVSEVKSILKQHHLLGISNVFGLTRRTFNRGKYKTYKEDGKYQTRVTIQKVQEYVYDNDGKMIKKTLDNYLYNGRTPVRWVKLILLLSFIFFAMFSSALFVFVYDSIRDSEIFIEMKNEMSMRETFEEKMKEFREFLVDLQHDDYVPEVKEYNGEKYFGNFTLDKPDGLCIRMDSGDNYLFGYFEENIINSFGIIKTDNYQYMGQIKNNRPNGFGIYKNVNGMVATVFVNGVASEYGILFDQYNEHKLISFKKDTWPGKGNNLDESYTVIARYDKLNKIWKTSDNKLLKTDNGVYKNFKAINEKKFAYKDFTFFYDTSGEIEIKIDNITMTLNSDFAKINEEREDVEDMNAIWIVYEFGTRIHGEIITEEEGVTSSQNFSVAIS